MKATPLGAILLTSCAALALASVLFMDLAFIVGMASALVLVLYSRLRFVAELDHASCLVEREILEKMTFAGENATVKVTVVNKADDRLDATFEDVLPDGCECRSGGNVAHLDLPPRSMLSFTYPMSPDRRGEFVLSGMKVRRTDAFGLFEHEYFVETVSRMKVHTRKQSLDAARKIAGREHLEYSGFSKSPAVVLQEFEFDGLRDYDFGDRARDIHWKSSSRLNRLMTKMYRREGAMQTMILVDCSSSMRLSRGPISKLDHAVDLAMQISNVLLSNMHSSGVGLFDEAHVVDETLPALGRRQFERIVKTLRNAPGSIDGTAPGPSAGGQAYTPGTSNARSEEERAFLTAIGSLNGRKSTGRTTKLGLEAEIARIAGTRRAQQKLFVVLTDLVSSRNAVLAGAKLCKRSNNKMLVINTHSDWYSVAGDDDIAQYESMYAALDDSVSLEKVLRRQGASFLRIGPADTAPRIVRTVRRGLA